MSEYISFVRIFRAKPLKTQRNVFADGNCFLKLDIEKQDETMEK